uniref:Uncharacterized protein n=1 Tax=Siphoviridae sp. ctBCr48 TaxID=2827802 RepID=A0A8S5SHH2_9CAUD|nr:MAG TPA: hypothetical protein [Siphoviridae sp. ctBCr48]
MMLTGETETQSCGKQRMFLIKIILKEVREWIDNGA